MNDNRALRLQPIIDPHHHIWDLKHNYHPWLSDEPMIPFRYGDYRAIRRDYSIADYQRDAGSLRVVGSVYVEAEWDPSDPVGEMRWVESIRAECGFPHAAVAQAWLDRDDAADVLGAQAEFTFVTGIRHKPKAAPNADAVRLGAPGSMGDESWRRGYELLEKYGLDFELQVVPWHLAEAAELAADFPGTQIILNHTGVPGDRSERGLALWREGMWRLAEQPNVVVKISGLGQIGVPWSVAGNRGIILEALAAFGVDRCMFASNFPVDGLCGSFDTIFNGFFEVTQHLGAGDQAKLFHDNAKRVYRLG